MTKRRHLPIAAATAALIATAAFAQAPETPPVGRPASPGAGAPATAPPDLSPRPEDRAATGTIPVVPGVDGDAPSDELTDTGAPIDPGTPGAGHAGHDAPADPHAEGAEQSGRSVTPSPPVPPAGAPPAETR